jgi:phage portal protein BeeE
MQTYLDSFTPVQQASRSMSRAEVAFTGGLASIDPTARWGSQNSLRVREMVRHYTGWNYVSINRICFKVSQQRPCIGRVMRGKKGSQHMSQAQRQHFQKFYGGVIQSHQDIEPAPESHPLVRLLDDVNPTDWYGSFAFELMLFWQLTGRFYIWTIESGIRDAIGLGGLPAELWVIPSHWMFPDYDRSTGAQTGWVIVPDGNWTRRLELSMSEVIYGHFKNPMSKVEGYSPTQAGGRWIDNSESIEASRWHGFRNGINPDLYIELDGERYNNPDENIIERIKEKFKARMAGVMKTGEPVIAPPGVKMTKWSNTPREMDWGTSADQTRDNILALRGTPKVIAGITDDVNRASIDGANVIFCESTINPLLAMQAGFLTERLAKRFDPDLLVWYQDCTPRDNEMELQETQLDAQLGAISPDERRIDRGRQPWGTPAAGSGYLPAGLIAIDEAAREELTPEPPPASDPAAAGGDGADEGDGQDAENADDESSDPAQ